MTSGEIALFFYDEEADSYQKSDKTSVVSSKKFEQYDILIAFYEKFESY